MKYLLHFFFVVLLFFILIVNGEAQVTLISPGGNHTIDGGLTVTVDPYGAFGSASYPGGEAYFNAPGELGYAGTTFHSATFFRSATFSSFLARGNFGGSGYQPMVNFTSVTPNEAQSLFFVDDLLITLKQTVTDRFTDGVKTGSSLVQSYFIQNSTSAQKNFKLIRYLDGDLYFSEAYMNDWGGERNLVLFEFDTGSNPQNPSTYLGIKTFGNNLNSFSSGFEINQYSGLLNRIVSGVPLDNSVYGDNNFDGITDFSYDITLALQRNYSLDPGESTFFVTVTDFGRGEFSQQALTDYEVENISEKIISIGGFLGFGRFEWDSGYDIEFVNQELIINIDIELIGADPGNELRDQWEEGIEAIWSDKYDIIDGIYSYPIKIRINWVEDNPDHTVRVHTGTGRTNMTNWYMDSPAGWPNTYQDEIAAHEAGHMLGQYDEYAEYFTDSNNNNRYDSGEPFVDDNPENDKWDFGALNPDTWLMHTGSLMDNLGLTMELHYENMLLWLEDKSDRGLSLAGSPLPPYLQDPPIDGFRDPQYIPVYFDIKPQSCPNPLNVVENGVLPVAILGTNSFDVNSIDPNSIVLEGVPRLRWSIEDVGTPIEIGDECNCTGLAGDGFPDMTFKFNVQEIVQTLGSVNNNDKIILTISGNLIDGTPIEGIDCIIIKGSIPKELSEIDYKNYTTFTLNDNYPNPFNPKTKISFYIPELASVTLEIFNNIGEKITTLIDKELSEGLYSTEWNAQNLSSGMYFYKLQANNFIQVKKMILLK